MRGACGPPRFTVVLVLVCAWFISNLALAVIYEQVLVTQVTAQGGGRASTRRAALPPRPSTAAIAADNDDAQAPHGAAAPSCRA